MSDWISNAMMQKLQQKFSNQNWQKKAKTNAYNKKSSYGSLHIGGSILIKSF